MANDPHFEVYPQREDHPDEDAYPKGRPTGEYGWRFVAANGQITATGGEGFTRREDAHRAVGDFVIAMRQATYGQRSEDAVGAAVVDVDD